ncbi:YceI family protein [Gulosibacter molinativorax]|uniref:Polyisoprenoid-binding protein n=1 Tax=Gulosibacter molinativorax TaxID=256821 RepID=A0ABT7C442_9MICO|nr:YceI family protein [Gulosibacter molinativorax]MDJ1369980.1 polyisoprenoid-binding protein [Gulosibacter molinativorax]QUY63830.1 Polyisoprenoid-binding protein [Gulosibacter molinativorax]
MAIDPQYAGKWNIDPAHSRIGFSTRHAMVARVRGAFNEVSGEANLNAEAIDQSTVRVVIQAASIDTRQGDRDNHLRSPDFLDVEQFPEIVFESNSIDEISDNNYIVAGQLTIHGISRPVSVPLELIGIESDPSGAVRAGLEGTRRIDRQDWGVSWNTPLDSGGVLVSDKITLEFELSLVKEQ